MRAPTSEQPLVDRASASASRPCPRPSGSLPQGGPTLPRRRNRAAGLACGVSLFVFLILQAFLPLRTAIRIGPDEDYEAAKATLCLSGYRLYTQVWNDQPPLHTFIITEIVKLTDRFGGSQPAPLNNVTAAHAILGPRLFTVGMTVLLLTAFFGLVLNVGRLMTGGRHVGDSRLWVPSLTILMLVASPAFLELSSSCMVEIPALAPAIAALWLLAASQKRHGPALSGLGIPWPVIGAGALFGISFQIKFINAPLLLLAAWIVADGCMRRSRENSSVPRGQGGTGLFHGPRIPQWCLKTAGLLSVLAVCIAGVFIGLNYVADGGSLWLQFKQSWAAHFAATKSYEYGSPADKPFDWTVLLKNWDITLPALLGVAVSIRQALWRPWSAARTPLDARVPEFRTETAAPGGLALLPPAWLALSLLIFGTHKPWWTYYYIHNLLPLCWCAAIGIEALGSAAVLGVRRNWVGRKRERNGRKEQRRIRFALILGLYLVCACPWMTARAFLEIRKIRTFPRIYSSLVLRELRRFKPFTEFLYTDEPIYSFHAGIPMPPQYAVVALKRFWSGDMTNARISSDLWSLKPGVILLRNNGRARPFDALLNSAYRLVYMDDQHLLYARADIATKAQ